MFEKVYGVGFFWESLGFYSKFRDQWKRVRFVPCYFFEKDESISDNYFLFLNCFDKLIHELDLDNWGIV